MNYDEMPLGVRLLIAACGLIIGFVLGNRLLDVDFGLALDVAVRALIFLLVGCSMFLVLRPDSLPKNRRMKEPTGDLSGSETL